MKVLVKKWGNSASVRIPAQILAAANLTLDQSVDIREESGRIIIEPIHDEPYNLADLVSAITPENLHTPIEIGTPQGHEIW